MIAHTHISQIQFCTIAPTIQPDTLIVPTAKPDWSVPPPLPSFTSAIVANPLISTPLPTSLTLQHIPPRSFFFMFQILHFGCN